MLHVPRLDDQLSGGILAEELDASADELNNLGCVLLQILRYFLADVARVQADHHPARPPVLWGALSRMLTPLAGRRVAVVHPVASLVALFAHVPGRRRVAHVLLVTRALRQPVAR